MPAVDRRAKSLSVSALKEMAMQSLFARAVGANLPSAIPTTLERIDQFAIGKVLTYKKKPRKLLPWRRHELNFTGRSITDLLAEGQVQQLNFVTSSDYLFDAGKGTDNIFVEVIDLHYLVGDRILFRLYSVAYLRRWDWMGS